LEPDAARFPYRHAAGFVLHLDLGMQAAQPRAVHLRHPAAMRAFRMQ
jgi:hypothetical protein